jgi:hypothetical protein
MRELNAQPVLITARPGFVESRTYKTLASYGLPDAVVLSGHLRDSVLIPVAPGRSNDMISRRKFHNYYRYMSVFYESQFLWLGDSGQGDVLMGRRMLADDTDRARGVAVRGVYIQDVVLADGVSFKTGPAERAALAREHILVCETYIDVAVDLHDRALLLPPANFRRVVADTVADLAALRPQFFDPAAATQLGTAAWPARVAEVTRAVAAANAVLVRAGLPPVDLAPLTGAKPAVVVAVQPAVAPSLVA